MIEETDRSVAIVAMILTSTCTRAHVRARSRTHENGRAHGHYRHLGLKRF